MLIHILLILWVLATLSMLGLPLWRHTIHASLAWELTVTGSLTYPMVSLVAVVVHKAIYETWFSWELWVMIAVSSVLTTSVLVVERYYRPRRQDLPASNDVQYATVPPVADAS